MVLVSASRIKAEDKLELIESPSNSRLITSLTLVLEIDVGQMYRVIFYFDSTQYDRDAVA